MHRAVAPISSSPHNYPRKLESGYSQFSDEELGLREVPRVPQPAGCRAEVARSK